jgi:hypothetical protein
MSLKDQSQADGFVVATVCSTGESYMRLTQDVSSEPRASRGQLTRSAWNGAHAMGARRASRRELFFKRGRVTSAG